MSHDAHTEIALALLNTGAYHFIDRVNCSGSLPILPGSTVRSATLQDGRLDLVLEVRDGIERTATIPSVAGLRVVETWGRLEVRKPAGHVCFIEPLVQATPDLPASFHQLLPQARARAGF